MPTYKNITVKKRGGGTRTQRVQVLKSGKYKFVKNLKTTKNKTSTKKSKTKRRSYTMARKVNRRRKSRAFKIPIAATAGFAATLLGAGSGAPQGQTALDHLMKKDWKGALARICANFTGYDPARNQWSLDFLNIHPLIIGAGVSWAASKFGLNRKIQQIPLIKV